jgi:predicted nuclease of predicted toxin-antitoxin system
MRFVVDEPLPRSVARAIQQTGSEATDVRDVHLRGATDQQILHYARKHGAVVVTADVGFADARLITSRDHPAIVLVRSRTSASGKQYGTEIANVLATLSDEQLTASIIVIEPGSVRIRKVDV